MRTSGELWSSSETISRRGLQCFELAQRFHHGQRVGAGFAQDVDERAGGLGDAQVAEDFRGREAARAAVAEVLDQHRRDPRVADPAQGAGDVVHGAGMYLAQCVGQDVQPSRVAGLHDGGGGVGQCCSGGPPGWSARPARLGRTEPCARAAERLVRVNACRRPFFRLA